MNGVSVGDVWVIYGRCSSNISRSFFPLFIGIPTILQEIFPNFCKILFWSFLKKKGHQSIRIVQIGGPPNLNCPFFWRKDLESLDKGRL